MNHHLIEIVTCDIPFDFNQFQTAGIYTFNNTLPPTKETQRD